MDSFKVQAVNMTQSTGHKKYVIGDVSTAGTYTYDWKLPAGAIVEKINVLNKVVFNQGTSAAIKVGDMADDDKFLVSTNIKGSAARTESAVAQQMQSITPYTGGASAENEYIVRATITTAGSAGSTGELYMWVDYRFDPSSAYVTKTFGETSVTEA